MPKTINYRNAYQTTNKINDVNSKLAGANSFASYFPPLVAKNELLQKKINELEQV
jgi:hypothetical protein